MAVVVLLGWVGGWGGGGVGKGASALRGGEGIKKERVEFFFFCVADSQIVYVVVFFFFCTKSGYKVGICTKKKKKNRKI